MSDHLTEEEQVENLKRLWKEYGTTIIASVAVATSAYFGWNYWQQSEQQRIAQASDNYEQLMASATSQATGEESEATTAHLAGQIKDSASDSAYAINSAFFAAKAAVENQYLDGAEAQLNWVLDNTEDAGFQQLAKIRLARVLAAKEDYEAALALVSDTPAKGFAAEQAEVRGDILNFKGDKVAANQAYSQALESLDSDQQQRNVVLQMKVNDTKPAATEPSA